MKKYNNILLSFFLTILLYSVSICSAGETTLPTVIVTEKNIDDCLARVDADAKASADIKSKEVVAKLEKNSAIAGGSTVLGCLGFSALVLGLDGGLLSAGCLAVGTIAGATVYGANSDSTAKQAIDTHKKEIDDYQTREYANCVRKYKHN